MLHRGKHQSKLEEIWEHGGKAGGLKGGDTVLLLLGDWSLEVQGSPLFLCKAWWSQWENDKGGWSPPFLYCLECEMWKMHVKLQKEFTPWSCRRNLMQSWAEVGNHLCNALFCKGIRQSFHAAPDCCSSSVLRNVPWTTSPKCDTATKGNEGAEETKSNP